MSQVKLNIPYMQIYTACHWKYQNKSSLMQTSASHSLLQVRRSDCAALLVMSPCRAVMLPATMSSDLAGNIGRVAIQCQQCVCTRAIEALFTESPKQRFAYSPHWLFIQS